jgi:hypothetical protein
VLFDVGSQISWVPSYECDAEWNDTQALASGIIRRQCDSTLFYPNGSNTFVNLTQNYTIPWFGGAVIGTMVKDFACIHSQSCSNKEFNFLLAYNVTGNSTTFKPDGVLGLAPQRFEKTNIVNNLFDNGAI